MQSVCTSFSVSNVSLCKKNMGKNCSVQRFLRGQGSVCKNAYVPGFMRAKASSYKASVCKYFLLCVKTSVRKGVSVQEKNVHKPLCVRISARQTCSV